MFFDRKKEVKEEETEKGHFGYMKFLILTNRPNENEDFKKIIFLVEVVKEIDDQSWLVRVHPGDETIRIANLYRQGFQYLSTGYYKSWDVAIEDYQRLSKDEYSLFQFNVVIDQYKMKQGG